MNHTLLAAIAGALASFTTASFISGGPHIFHTYLLFLAGTIVENTPRRLLPDRLVWWYNDTLLAWHE